MVHYETITQDHDDKVYLWGIVERAGGVPPFCPLLRLVRQPYVTCVAGSSHSCWIEATTFQASARRALNMWRAENALRNNQPPKQVVTTRAAEVATASATVIGRESDSAVQTQPGTETRETSEPNSEAADDTPYTHVSFFSESMTSDSDRTLTRRRLPFSLPLPAGNTNVTQATEMCSWGCGIWMKFLLVWLCMIFVVAIRGGDGNSILAIRGCSWEYWVVTATGFLLLMFPSLTSEAKSRAMVCLKFKGKEEWWSVNMWMDTDTVSDIFSISYG